MQATTRNHYVFRFGGPLIKDLTVAVYPNAEYNKFVSVCHILAVPAYEELTLIQYNPMTLWYLICMIPLSRKQSTQHIVRT